LLLLVLVFYFLFYLIQFMGGCWWLNMINEWICRGGLEICGWLYGYSGFVLEICSEFVEMVGCVWRRWWCCKWWLKVNDGEGLLCDEEMILWQWCNWIYEQWWCSLTMVLRVVICDVYSWRLMMMVWIW
jgi:hypothetical protein